MLESLTQEIKMKRYMIRHKKTGLFSYGHGDYKCRKQEEEGKLYVSLASAKKGLSYALKKGKQHSKWAIERNAGHWRGLFLRGEDFSLRDARRFLDLYEKKEIKNDYEIVEFNLVESKVHNAG
jgi:hypothetical protein